jgi:endoglucanase
VTYIGGDVHDVVVTISRGKGRYLVQTILPNSTQGMSVQTATNESMIAAPTQLRLGDATHSYYVSRIDVWDTDIQDITQAGDIGSFGHNYVAAKGSNLPVFLNGHNLSGLEDGNGPFEGELDYYKNFGINYYRIPFQAEKLFTTWIAYTANNSNPFPTVGNTTVAGMDATYVQQIDRFVNYAVANGAGVLLDWHSYAGPMGKTLGGTFPDALFKQAWKAIATRWPNCDYDLQNEPANAVVANWPATMQQAVDGIREAGATGYIHLEPAGSFGALSTFAPGSTIADAMLAVTDGLNKLVYHGHQYLDHDGSGRYEDIAGRYIGLTRAQLPYAWARIHGVKLFVGEIGATNNPGSNPDQDREARWFFKNMYANRDVLFGWAYWTGGIYFQDYYYGTWPRNWNTVNQTDRPQMSYLKLYPGTGYTPPGPVTLPVITLSTETDVSSLAGDTTNVYQTDLRIDPSNASRQAITAKYGVVSSSTPDGELNTVAFTTNDRWSTASKVVQGSAGDPDVAFDKDGNAFWTYIDKGSGTLGIRKKLAGATTWGTAVQAFSSRPDHPHVIVDPWPTSPHYNRKYIAGRTASPAFVYSDDGVTWTQATLPGDAKFNGGAGGNIWGGSVAKTGEIFWSWKSSQDTLLTSGGAYNGVQADFYVLRSRDGGTSYSAVKIYTSQPVASNGPGGHPGLSNVGYTPPTTAIPNGRLHVVVPQYVSGGPTKLMYFTSDDLGLTWTPAGPTLLTVSGYGARSACFSVNSTGMLVLSAMMDNGSNLRMYAIASRDSGASWCTPVKINTTDFAAPTTGTQNRTPSLDQILSAAALSDGSFEIVWTQNVGSNTYHAQRRKITVA